MKEHTSSLLVFEIDKRHDLHDKALDLFSRQLGENQVAGYETSDQIVHFTLVVASSSLAKVRSAQQLQKAKPAMETHLAGWDCLSVPDGQIGLDYFLETAPGKTVGRSTRTISDLQQFHLFEHLLMNELDLIKNWEYALSARTLYWDSKEQTLPTIVFNDTFQPVLLRFLLDTVWGQLGRALALGKYPTVSQLRAMMKLHERIHREPGYAERILRTNKGAR